MSDKINIEELEKLSELGYLDHKINLAGSYGEGKNKSLNMIVNSLNKRIYFEVTHNKKCVAKVPDLKDAIKIYNNI